MGCDGVWEEFGESCEGMTIMLNSIRKEKNTRKKVLGELLEVVCSPKQDLIGCDNMTAILI
jgi:hypothetical protein